MSASLVGSEMCIRDRAKTSQDTTQQDHNRHGTTRQAKTRNDQTRQDETRPVSYTHLTLPTICSV
eukprot:14280937-Alexandrium_andersonii.AAC.1